MTKAQLGDGLIHLPRHPQRLNDILLLIAKGEEDFRPRQTRTRYSLFVRAFKRYGGNKFEQRLARLTVLYEDLRVEVLAAALNPGSVPNLEPFGPNYRQLYFMRRAIATAHEFRQTLEQIDNSTEFSRIAGQGFGPDYDRFWKPAIAFFRANRNKLRTIRNDVGGHFGDEAVANVFATIPDDYVINIEMQSDLINRTRLLFPFAAEFTAVALLRHLPGRNPGDKSEALLALLQECAEHAVEAVHFLVAEYLWGIMT